MAASVSTPPLLWPDRVDQALLDEVVSRIVRAVDPERIVLFGPTHGARPAPTATLTFWS